MSGFNNEIKYKGISLHVQTQDKGLQAQYVETLIYKAGRLIFSQKSSYTQFLEDPALKTKIAQIMEKQHFTFLNEIYDGKYDRYLLSER
ncbi:MAG: hypothetical protein WCC06_04320 [Candidatus Aminicenantales bacterium]